MLRLKYSGMEIAKPTVDGPEFTVDELILPARGAQLKGKTIRHEGGHIGCWIDPKESVSWVLNVPAPGKFRVRALYACAKRYL